MLPGQRIVPHRYRDSNLFNQIQCQLLLTLKYKLLSCNKEVLHTEWSSSFPVIPVPILSLTTNLDKAAVYSRANSMVWEYSIALVEILQLVWIFNCVWPYWLFQRKVFDLELRQHVRTVSCGEWDLPKLRRMSHKVHPLWFLSIFPYSIPHRIPIVYSDILVPVHCHSIEAKVLCPYHLQFQDSTMKRRYGSQSMKQMPNLLKGLDTQSLFDPSCCKSIQKQPHSISQKRLWWGTQPQYRLFVMFRASEGVSR